MATINYAIVARKNPLDQEKVKYYASAQVKERLDLTEFAEHITSHGCVYSHADIVAILEMTSACIQEQLLAGNSISISGLGTFSISLSNKGADSAAEFTTDNIKAVNVRWRAGKTFKNLRAKASFNLVPTKAQSQSVVTGVKNGKTTVSI